MDTGDHSHSHNPVHPNLSSNPSSNHSSHYVTPMPSNYGSPADGSMRASYSLSSSQIVGDHPHHQGKQHIVTPGTGSGVGARRQIAAFFILLLGIAYLLGYYIGHEQPATHHQPEPNPHYRSRHPIDDDSVKAPLATHRPQVGAGVDEEVEEEQELRKKLRPLPTKSVETEPEENVVDQKFAALEAKLKFVDAQVAELKRSTTIDQVPAPPTPPPRRNKVEVPLKEGDDNNDQTEEAERNVVGRRNFPAVTVHSPKVSRRKKVEHEKSDVASALRAVRGGKPGASLPGNKKSNPSKYIQ